MAIVSFLLALPFVQTKLGNSATSFLKKEFDVDIKLGKVDLSILGKVNFKEVLIVDHHSDTLIYAQNLKSSLYSFKKILDNKLEFGEIYLDNFKLYIKTYKGEEDNGLTVFVEKFGESDPDKPSTFKMSADNLRLKDGYVEITDENEEKDVPLFFKNITGSGNDFKIRGPNVNVSIKGFSFIENHGVEAKSLSTDFAYTKTSMDFLNIDLETKASTLKGDIKFSYDRDNLSDFNNKVDIDGDIREADISLVDIRNFYDEIGTADRVHFSSKVNGQLNSLNLIGLKLKTDKGAIIDGTINLKNSFQSEKGFSIEGKLNELSSNYDHLTILLPQILGKNLPIGLKEIGRFHMKGDVYVNPNLISADVAIKTDIGSTISDVELTNINSVENVSYTGDVKIIDFQLGKILKDSLMGNISLEADIDGQGFTFESLNTSVNGIISEYEYDSYQYTDISLDGVVKQKHFNGNLEVNDENIKLNFNGLADLSLDVYEFDFKATVDHCDLYRLNVFKRDSISILKGDIEINLKGTKLDNMKGKVSFKNSLYTNHKGNYFFKDFAVTSSFKDSVRTVTINSPEIVEGEINGKFNFYELGKIVQNSIGSIYTHYEPFEITPNQYLEFKFQIYNKIVEVFWPDVVLSANTFIRGEIDADENLFKLNVRSPKVTAYDTRIDSLYLQIDNKNPLFNTQLMVNKVNSKIYDISDLYLVNKTLNDTLYFGTEFKGGKNNSEHFNLSFYHTFNKQNQSVVGIQKSSVLYKNNEWLINPNNDEENSLVIDGAKKLYTFTPFLITSNKQSVHFSGIVNDTISKELNFNFKNVNLGDITPEVDSLEIEGLINGDLNYIEVDQQIKPTINLTISDFEINDSEQGNLTIDIEGKNSLSQFALDINLERLNNTNFSAVGDVDFSTQSPTLDVTVEFNEFKLDAFSPLGEDVFNRIRGFAYGNVQLTGVLNNPIMEGELYLDEAGLYFPYLNVDFDFLGTSVITMNNQVFNFEDVTVRDKENDTRADLRGTLSHENFKRWDLDLRINTKNLMVLNTKEDEASLYYGTAFFGGQASIKGPTDKLVINVVGKTNKGTHFVMPLSDVKTAETSQLIRFIDENEDLEKEEVRRAYISEKLKGLSMNFNLDVTKDAIFEMVVDKSSGSNLSGIGTGNLQIQLDTKDKFDMYGDFLVDKGTYDFKYGGIINKPFTVRKGGTISWSGDPLTAEMNIEAIHRVSANPKTLLENISSSRKMPIDLITRFTGELFNSDIEFDIEIPNSSSTVASELEFKINNDKTVQFISLLVTGSFYNEGNLGSNGNTALYGTGADLLASAFDNIFNDADSKFKVTPVYTVGDRNTVESLDIDDQLSLAVDYQVSDRVLVNGNFGMPVGADTKATVIGEVTVEFLLNESGTLRSSVFNRQNDIQYSDQDEEGYTQGIGLTYQIDFENGGELLEKLSLKKKKVTDSVNTVQVTDTIKNQKLVKFKTKKSIKDE